MSRKTTPTYVLLNQITLAATSSGVTFSNIPQNYGDLVLVVNTGSAMNHIDLRPNADSANKTSVHMVAYSGISTESYVISNFSSGTSAIYSRFFTYNIMDYSQTDKHKAILARQNVGTFQLGAMAGRWSSLAAISELNLVALEAAFPVGSTFSLYGLVA